MAEDSPGCTLVATSTGNTIHYRTVTCPSVRTYVDNADDSTHKTTTTPATPAGLMRPSELKIVHLTPNHFASWQRSQQSSPAFRSPAPWLSRPVPSPLHAAVDEKTGLHDVSAGSGSGKLPPRYSRFRGDRRSRMPPRYAEEPPNPDKLFSRRRRAVQDFLSEFFGTFIMILLGDGVVAQNVLARGTKGDYQSINWGWGWVITYIWT